MGRAKHGQHGSPTYRSWRAMINRCLNQNDKAYPRYGGVGIGIDDPDWLIFENFMADKGLRPPGTTLDRKDNSKGYSNANCRWATREQQQRNRKDQRMNLAKARAIRASTETQIVLARRYGVSRSLISAIQTEREWKE